MHTRHYSNHETYTEQKVVVHSGPSLPTGIHYLPFTFLLPPNLPTSFESATGKVRYFIKAEIVRSWKWNHKAKQHFMVNGVLDLNVHPAAKQEGRLCCT